MSHKKIYSAIAGTNSELFKNVADLYFDDGMKIADVTYGKGVFWKDIDKSLYRIVDGIFPAGRVRTAAEPSWVVIHLGRRAGFQEQ